MRKAALVASILIALLAATVVLARYFLFEKVTETVEREYSGEAAYNPYFALRELYTGLGADARTISGLQSLPPTDHTLILAVKDRPLVDREVERLLGWTRRGGHLVVPAAHRLTTKPFLNEAGVESFDRIDADDDDADSTSEFRTQRTTWPKLYTRDEQPLARSDGAEDAAWVLSVEYGSGMITVPTGLVEFRNPTIADEEHAVLAWWLVQGRGGEPPAGVWIAYRQAPVSVWSYLSRRGRPVIFALVLLSAVGLALFARPLGPRLDAPPRDRRHLAEHLNATGRFLWDREVEHTMLRAVQSGALQAHRLSRSGKPTPRELVELVQQVCARSGEDPERLHAALSLPSTRDPQQFTDTIHALEELRRKT